MCYGNLDPKYANRDLEVGVKPVSLDQAALKPTTSLPQAVLLAVNTIRRSIQVLAAAAAIAVTGCVETSSPPEIPRNTPLSADVRKDMLDGALADQIAKRCRGNLMLNFTAFQQLRERAEVEGRRRGMSRASSADVIAIMGGERFLQDQILSYVQRRDILINQPSTWCAAGKRELSEKTAIGKYLIAR